MSTPDFEALRAKRNAETEALYTRLEEEYDMEPLHKPDPNRCFCACSTGGPCEHKWDGKWVEFENGGSASCSRCGCLAIAHSMRCF